MSALSEFAAVFGWLVITPGMGEPFAVCRHRQVRLTITGFELERLPPHLWLDGHQIKLLWAQQLAAGGAE